MARLEVITGPMFSGKTTELIRRVTRHRIAGRTAVVYKPRMDDRYADKRICTHDGREERARRLGGSDQHWDIDMDADVLAFDEAQFLDQLSLHLVIRQLLNEDKLVIVAGLDKNYLGLPFGHGVSYALAIADDVTKLQAVCQVCGEDASMTYKKGGGADLMEVGGHEIYEARCRTHWPPGFE